MVMDRDGRIVRFNRACEERTGYSTGEVIGRSMKELSFVRAAPEAAAPVFRTMPAAHYPGSFEESLVSKEGRIFQISWSATHIKNHRRGIQWIICTGIDITELREKEEELLRARKLESIGLLAGGIAHDFNNILTAILGNASLAKVDTDPEAEAYQLLTEVEKASWQAKKLTHQLLTFAKGGAPVKKVTLIADLIKNAVHFALRGSNVGCEFNFAPDLWPVEVDEGQFHQVIGNLIINADQAMPEGGMVRVIAENLKMDEGSRGVLEKGKYVKVSVIDRGIGIPPDHLPRIFDPYFSTKKKGNGLGLATTYSIVQKHQGHISVESNIGAGSSFHVYLPASDKPLPPKVKEEETLALGEGRILVMDDEDRVRVAAGLMLKRLGYEPAFARDGTEAIEMHRKAVASGKPYEIFILDLTVPGGMGGIETLKKLLKSDPRIKAVVSSGYSTDPIMSDFKRYGFLSALMKPYQIRELSTILHEALKQKYP